MGFDFLHQLLGFRSCRCPTELSHDLVQSPEGNDGLFLFQEQLCQVQLGFRPLFSDLVSSFLNLPLLVFGEFRLCFLFRRNLFCRFC